MVFCSDSTSAPDSIASTISSTVTSSSPLSPPASDRARSPAPAAHAPHTLSTPVPGSGGSPSPSSDRRNRRISPQSSEPHTSKNRLQTKDQIYQSPSTAQCSRSGTDPPSPPPRFANRLTISRPVPYFPLPVYPLPLYPLRVPFRSGQAYVPCILTPMTSDPAPYISGCTPIFRFITTSVPIPDATLLPAHP